MGRKSARENAFKLVYQMSFRSMDELDDVIDVYFRENPISKRDYEFIRRLTCGVFDCLPMIDKYIEQNSSNWSKERIDRVDMAIMRVSVYELINMSEIPTGVSINEAVELAKKFGSDESPTFINGVLGATEKEIKRCE